MPSQHRLPLKCAVGLLSACGATKCTKRLVIKYTLAYCARSETRSRLKGNNNSRQLQLFADLLCQNSHDALRPLSQPNPGWILKELRRWRMKTHTLCTNDTHAKRVWNSFLETIGFNEISMNLQPAAAEKAPPTSSVSVIAWKPDRLKSSRDTEPPAAAMCFCC